MNCLRKKVIVVIFILCIAFMSSIFFTHDMNELIAGESGISKNVLSVKCQVSENATTQTSKLRIVSTIDNLENYKKAGFDITYKGKIIPYETTKAYQSIEAVSGGVEYDYSPNIFDTASKFFITVTLINIVADDYDEGILIKPYVVPVNGDEKVYGTHRYVSVADAKDSMVLNLPVEIAASDDATYTVTSGDTTYSLETEAPYYNDGTYTHFRIDTDRTALKSVTTFTVSDGTNTYTANYRNLNNAYNGTETTIDTTWYDENSDYNVIVSSADLYGFVKLSANNNFALDTIYLGADIVVNEDTSIEWLAKAEDDDNTNDAYTWTPIGSTTAFAGKFYGQGHTISGLFVKTGSHTQALFAQTSDNSHIQDFRMENSYFEVTGQNTACIAAVSSKGGGIFDTIYVGEDVTIISSGLNSGGIIGRVNDSANATISNCWFAGSVQTIQARAGGIVGAVGNTGKAKATVSHCFNSGNVTTSVNTKDVYTGGICGGVFNTSSLTITDCLNVGKITSSSYTDETVKLAAILGFKGTSATYTGSGTYATSDSCSPKSNSGSVPGSRTYAKSEIKGFSGYLLAKLAFTATDSSPAYWVVRANDTPALASLVDSAIRTIPSTTWHDEPNSVEEDDTRVYTIETVADLYGFSKLSAEGVSFADEKIQLGADIKLNKGLAASWAKYAPDNEWVPIGKTTPFEGTFDGQGHTISGVYVKGTNYVGLFAKTADNSMIRDVRLKNSYFCDTDATETASYTGSIVGHGLGDLNTVYSDAIIHGNNQGTGGLVGIVNGTGKSEIVNCQFDGSIEISTTNAETRTGGIVGSLQTGSVEVNVSHCLNTGSIHSVANSSNTRMGGLCGTVGGSCVLNVTDCLVVGSLTSDGTFAGHRGALTGQKGGSAKIYIQLSYASKDSCNALTGSTPSSIDTYSSLKNASDLVGQLAYDNTYLQFDSPDKEALFDGHWVITDGTPMLRSFVEGEIQYPTSIKNDIRWWDSETTSFTICTAEELYGFAYLVRANKDLFAGDTVNLGANIIVNSGDAAQWGEDKPNYSWSMIGNTTYIFGGTFNGQNHTISGLYLSGTSSNVGLFAMTATSTVIQNVSIENTYFTGKSAIGTIAGQGGGTFHTIHIGSDVYLENTVDWCGGIIGLIKTGSVTTGTTDSPGISTDTHRIENCWFEGTIRTAQHGGGITGSVGKFENEGISSAKRYATNALIKNCLNTGTIIHTAGTTARAGGLVGAVVSTYDTSAQKATLISGLTIEDSFCAGSVYSEISGAGKMGAVVGHIFNGSDITCTDVYATRECNSESYVAVPEYVDLTNATVTRHFEDQMTGFSAYVNTPGLVYDNQYLSTAGNGTWVAVQNDYPVLKSFADGYTAVDFSPFVLNEASVITDMTDQGGGNASFTVNGDYSGDYIKKIAGESGLGFTLCYSNSVGSGEQTVSMSSYKKDDLVITVTYVKGTDITYISAGSNVGFSEYLTDNVSGNETNGQMSLGMLELEKASGSSYVIQLENGHFIIEDGGETQSDYNNLVAYLNDLTPNDDKPIIDAWIISHAHVDHFGVLKYVNGSDVNVEGFYYSQASGDSSNAETIRNGAKLFQTTSGDATEVYRMYTGQTYYFDGVTMEVLLTHEQLTGYTDFNETSVWCKYTIGSGDDAKIFLNGADADSMGMNFMMTAYSADYLYSDFFAALHHGVNILDRFKTYLANNTQANGYVAEHAILYSRQSNPNDKDEYLTSVETSGWYEEFAKDIARQQILEYNRSLNDAVRTGIGDNKFFYYGAGTVRFDFTSTGITYIQ